MRGSAALSLTLCTLCAALVACEAAEQSAERARTRAHEALAQGERDAALDAIADLSRATPDDPASIRERAALLIRAGEAPRVVWLLEEAVARFPEEPLLRLQLSEAALLVNDPVRANAVAAEIPAAGEAGPLALLVRARATLALGDLEAALALFESAERAAPQRIELRAARIAALLGERRFDEAALALEQAKALGQASDARLLESLSLALHQYRGADARRRLRAAQQSGDGAASDLARRELEDALADVGGLARTDAQHLAAWQHWIAGLLEAGRAADAAREIDAALAQDPAPLALYPLLARVRLALADPDGAERALRSLAERDPRAAALPLARFLEARGRVDEAIAVLEGASSDAADPELATLRAELLLTAGRLDAADQAIAALPDRPPRELLAARLVLARGDADAAALRLEQLAPTLDVAATHYWLARALEARGDHAGAERRYALAALRSPEEPGPYLEILRLARRRGAWREVAATGQQLVLRLPGVIDGWEALVAALLKLGEPGQAEQVALRAEALLPEDPAPLILRARALRGQGRHEQASATLVTARERFGDSPDLAAERALAIAAAGRSDEALAVVADALESQPERATLHYARAVVLFGAGRFEAGSTAVDTALTLDPQDPRPLRSRCRFTAASGRHELSQRDCRRYLAARPDDAEIHFVLGAVLQAGGDGDAAIESYRRAAALDPRAPAPRNNLAGLLYSRGELDAALEAAQSAYALADRNPQVLDTLGELYVAKGLPDRAIALLERAHSLDPDLAVAELHLAQAYQAAGRSEEARRHLTHLLGRSEASPLHAQARKLLAAL